MRSLCCFDERKQVYARQEALKEAEERQLLFDASWKVLFLLNCIL